MRRWRVEIVELDLRDDACFGWVVELEVPELGHDHTSKRQTSKRQVSKRQTSKRQTSRDDGRFDQIFHTRKLASGGSTDDGGGV